MRANVLLLLLLAAALGMAGSIVLSSLVDVQPTVAQSAPTERIYVALNSIESGRVICQEDMRLEAWHRDNVPPGAIRRMEDIHQQVATRALRPGEPIVSSLLADAREHRSTQSNTQVAQATTEPSSSAATLATTSTAAAEKKTEKNTENNTQKNAEPNAVAAPAAVASQTATPPAATPDSATGATAKPATESVASDATGSPEPLKNLPTPPATTTATNATTKTGPNDEYLVMSVHTPEQVKVIKWRRSEGALLPAQLDEQVAQRHRAGAHFSMSDEGDTGVLRGAGEVAGDGASRAAKRTGSFDERAFRGRPVVVVFGATSNTATREELIEMSRLVERYREEGMELVSVNVDTQREFVQEFLKELGPNGVPLYHMTSRDAASRFGVNKLPAVMVLDAAGEPLAPPQPGREVDATIARRLNKTVVEPQISKKPTTETRR